MKLKCQFETEVYLSVGGYVVIKQDNDLHDENTVSLSLEQVRILARELHKYADDPSWWDAEVTTDQESD